MPHGSSTSFPELSHPWSKASTAADNPADSLGSADAGGATNGSADTGNTGGSETPDA